MIHCAMTTAHFLIFSSTKDHSLKKCSAVLNTCLLSHHKSSPYHNNDPLPQNNDPQFHHSIQCPITVVHFIIQGSTALNSVPLFHHNGLLLNHSSVLFHHNNAVYNHSDLLAYQNGQYTFLNAQLSITMIHSPIITVIHYLSKILTLITIAIVSTKWSTDLSQ